jgi:hypothetical protein
MATHGTATNPQFVQVITPLNVATATALTGFDPKKVIKAFESDGAGLTAHLRLVMTAMTTGQQLTLQPADKPATPKLLELVSTVPTVAAQKFKASDFFTVGTKNGVRIGYVSDNFKARFGKKVEEDVPAGNVNAHNLLQASLDPPIITELGDKHETSLSEVSQLMTAQGNGENGTLLTNGYANIFYVRDTEGTLWAVHVSWHSDGWNVYADSVENPGEWNAGIQVLSR